MATAVDNIAARYQEALLDPSLPLVQAWKERHPGARAVGVFPVYSPVEIVHAAGMLPVGLLGAGNQLEIAYADARFQSFICSIIKSTTEMALTGRLKVFDGLVFQGICDAARNLASVMARNLPGMRVEYLHLSQNQASPAAEDYLVGEYRRFQSAMEELSGRRVTEDGLRQSIAAYNRVRALVRVLNGLRARSPELVSALECYLLARLGATLPPEGSAPVLESALVAAQGRQARPKDRVRVVVQGSFCEVPPVELISALEEAGCYILDDDLLLGWRCYEADLPTEGDPLRSLARAYLNSVRFSSVRHGLDQPRATDLVAQAKQLRADAVIYLAAKFCEPALLDYALFRQALEQAGIPHLFLEFEEKMWLVDKPRNTIETFVESLLFD
ncbi:MAG: 2-hydroxyacyl-CoA dehydratase [Chloroflexi bacterium]|nr:2-hydroxyacyl-CoA dehydratase [Chloroflexota bacterium]